jgi:hypothetical protein
VGQKGGMTSTHYFFNFLGLPKFHFLWANQNGSLQREQERKKVLTWEAPHLIGKWNNSGHTPWLSALKG